MLTLVEKILFAAAVLVSVYFTYRGMMRIIGHISSGQGKPDWKLAWKRIGEVIVKAGLFQPVFRFRLGPSILHALIGWGFITFLLINLADLIYAYTGFKLLENTGWFGNFYRWLADVAGMAIILGIIGMAVRRFILRPRIFPRANRRCSTRRPAWASCAIRPLWLCLSLSITRPDCSASCSMLRRQASATAGNLSFRRSQASGPVWTRTHC